MRPQKKRKSAYLVLELWPIGMDRINQLGTVETVKNL